jgi:phosphoribosylamine--glycine ligase
MDLLVIGGGGREHALVWKFRQSSLAGKIYCAPGNPGIAELAECVPLRVNQVTELRDWAREHRIGLTVVGPEEPLTLGIVDAFEAVGLPIFGPNRQSAQLEGSKAFAKAAMERFGIPTAAYAEFTDLEDARRYVREQGAPIVIKADGLAAGKGVTVAETLEDAEQALEDALGRRLFGEAGARVVVEECLRGEEMTLLAFVDGATVRPMVPSQDHKPIFDGDRGPNTGGMGAYSPVPHLEHHLPEIMERILQPLVSGLHAEGQPYRGVLYVGLMITEAGPKVIEFNARLGDPEAQVILPRMKSDLLQICLATLEGALDEIALEWSPGASVCVIAAAPGYPGPPTKGLPIALPSEIPEQSQLFHAGTALQQEQLVTAGGRVFGVSAQGADVSQARQRAYHLLEQVQFSGKQFRSDIALKALRS